MCTMLGRRKTRKGDMGQDLSAVVFDRYSENGKMRAEGLLKFLQTEQGDTKSTLEDAKRLLELNRKDNKPKYISTLYSLDLTKEDFSNYLLNPNLNGVLDTAVHQDMTQPLSHYYIFTGHNSYLTGNQLSSDSSEVPIIAALRRGVRVVELDLWPDDKGGVKVTHGNTLTNPVPFGKCVAAIKDNAFVSSDYPVCVTLEDHLTSALQARAAEMLTRILGDALYYPPTSDALIEFPSPESLKGRIIVSTKPPKEYLEACAVQKPALKDQGLLKQLKKEDMQEEKKTVPVKEEKKTIVVKETTPSPFKAGTPQTPVMEESTPAPLNEEATPPSPAKEAATPASPKEVSTPASLKEEEANLSDKVGSLHIDKGAVAAAEQAGPASTESCEKVISAGDSDSEDDDSKKNPEYARLITIRQVKPVKGTSMKDRLKVEDTVKRISLAESKIKDVAEEFPDLVVKFTQRNILRVYPDGSRVNSSNYNPVLAWNHGAQMVAQNMQGYGKELWQAHGKFRGNGGCGYVLKPKFLLENSPNGDPFNPLKHKDTAMVFRLKVLMTLGWDKAFSKRHFDLFSPPDFFTRVLIAGVPADEAKWKTKVVDDTWVPHWNEDHEFFLKVPELALLRIEVRDYDEESKDEFEGQTCLPISEIRDGYRCVQMYDKKGMELVGVKMLFHFEKKMVGGTATPPASPQPVL